MAVETEALIPEARERSRRRRRRSAAAALAGVLALAAGLLALLQAGADGRAIVGETSSRPFANPRAFGPAQGNLAFVSRSRLWVLDGASGRLRVITPAYVGAADPMFSPNGRWLAYSVENDSQTWIARSDGSDPRLVSASDGLRGWLPDGKLMTYESVWAIGRDGVVRHAGAVPVGLESWSHSGTGYVFSAQHLDGPTTRSVRGYSALSVAPSLIGRRTVWWRAPIAFSPSGGLTGWFLFGVSRVQPRGGIVFHAADICCDVSDGTPLYLLRGRGETPTYLGFSLVNEAPSFAPDGEFAFTDGLSRYAWVNKQVAVCSRGGQCSPIRAPARTVSDDPAFSPEGRTLAFVEARADWQGDIGDASVQGWYGTRSLWLLHAGTRTPVRVPDSTGAAAPTWSANGELLYVAGDALWLLPSPSARPVRIAAPLFQPGVFGDSFFGQVDWTDQFAWSEGP